MFISTYCCPNCGR